MVLPNAMPMDRGSVILHTILDIHDHHIAPIGEQCRTWVLAVDELAGHFAVAVGVAGRVCDFPVVGYGAPGYGVDAVGVGEDAVAVCPALAVRGGVGEAWAACGLDVVGGLVVEEARGRGGGCERR